MGKLFSRFTIISKIQHKTPKGLKYLKTPWFLPGPVRAPSYISVSFFYDAAKCTIGTRGGV